MSETCVVFIKNLACKIEIDPLSLICFSVSTSNVDSYITLTDP